MNDINTDRENIIIDRDDVFTLRQLLRAKMIEDERFAKQLQNRLLLAKIEAKCDAILEENLKKIKASV